MRQPEEAGARTGERIGAGRERPQLSDGAAAADHEEVFARLDSPQQRRGVVLKIFHADRTHAPILAGNNKPEAAASWLSFLAAASGSIIGARCF
jgi:hypothetical protein